MLASGIGANVFINGASQGIGLALVKHIAKVGGVKNIFAGCRDPINAKELQKLEISTNCMVKMIRIDVQNDDSIKAAFDEVKNFLGKDAALNLLINNTGPLENKGETIDSPRRNFLAKHFHVNTIGALMTCGEFLPLVYEAGKKNESAKILNINSALGTTTGFATRFPDNKIVYGMASLKYYTKAIAGGIVAIAVCPGQLRTDEGARAPLLKVDESVSAIVELIASSKMWQSGSYLDKPGRTIAF